MQEFEMKIQTKPEAKLQAEMELFLKARDWYVKSTHGNMFQSGFPDLYCHHLKYRARWIELKIANHYSFTPAQRLGFPKMSAFGVGIWILTAATEEEYRKLWLPPNWHEFLSINKLHSKKILKPKKHGYTPKFPCPGLKDKK